MPLDEWRALFELSDRHGFVIASDECYSEIYFRDEPPLGALQAARSLGRDDFRRLVVFTQPVQAQQRAGHALGLRRRRRCRAEELPALPHLPRQRDEPGGAGGEHRGLERRGPRAWPTASSIAPSSRRSRRCSPACSTWPCPTPASTCGPPCPSRQDASAGGVGDDVAFAVGLLAQYNVAVLPGSLLARDAHGVNPGRGRIRMALVAGVDECVEAAQRIVSFTRTLP